MIDIIKEALMITGFILIMMLVIEYINVVSFGSLQEKLRTSRWGQYLLAAVLGATPGCLGAFAVVTLYAHRVVTAGALMSAMIATCGDEAFLMLAMFPGQAVLLIALLAATGFIIGMLTDIILNYRVSGEPEICSGFELHDDFGDSWLPRGKILKQWRECSLARGVLCAGLLFFLFAVAAGGIGEALWVRITLALSAAVALFIAATASDHFLEEHLLNHVVCRHIPRIFLWTLGALVVIEIGTSYLDLSAWISESRLIVLLTACLVGLIPESGPHMIFVTLYAQGAIPFSVLLASSVVQDGHGMLPLLAHSRREFILVKGANFIVGLLWGLAGYLGGW